MASAVDVDAALNSPSTLGVAGDGSSSGGAGGEPIPMQQGMPEGADDVLADEELPQQRRARKLTGFVEPEDVPEMQRLVAAEEQEHMQGGRASINGAGLQGGPGHEEGGADTALSAAGQAPMAGSDGEGEQAAEAATPDAAGAASPSGGWRQRAAQKAMKLRTKADEAMKAANEQIADYNIGARVAAASKAAGDAATQVQKKATQAFNEFALAGETGVNVLMLREDVTLAEMIQESDFAEECRKRNKRLIKYLARPNVMMELVGFIVNAAGDEDGLMRRYQFPFVAVEAASSCPQLISAMVDEELVLEGLFNFLQTDADLDPLLAGYFQKLVTTMLQVEKIRVAEYFETHPGILERLLYHIYAYSIKELVSAILGAPFRRSMDRTPQIAPVLNGPLLPLAYIQQEDVLFRLVCLIESPRGGDVHSHAAQVLTSIVEHQQVTAHHTYPLARIAVDRRHR
eukprot:SAG22_NODE_21_length_31784_cov_15.522897_2_plen_458_part_00